MARPFVVIVALLLVSTATFGQNMQKGDFVGDVKVEGWTLAAGSGTRTAIIFVKFTKPYESTPTVMVSVTGHSAKAGKNSNINLAAAAEKVTRDGFVIKVSTWEDSQVFAVYGSWIAWGK
jgi:hypothetical protein